MAQIRSKEREIALNVGGSSGLGLLDVERRYLSGMDVVVTSRSEQRAAETTSHLRGRGRIFPLGLDLAQPQQVDRAVDYLKEHKIRPKVVRISSATGLENFFNGREVFNALRDIRKSRDTDAARYTQAVASFNARTGQYLLDNRAEASAVNFEGPWRLITKMMDEDLMQPGSALVYDSSIPSSFYGLVDTPRWYEIVSSTKAQMEHAICNNAEMFSSRGIAAAIISGHIYKAGKTARAIMHVLSVLSGEEQKKMRGYMIAPEDMLNASDQALAPFNSSHAPSEVVRLFVYGENGRTRITPDLTPEHPMFQIASPI